jgi:hypothetical protein
MEKRVKVQYCRRQGRQRRSVCPDWLGAGGRCRCRCRCCCGRAGEMQLAAGRWARSYWVCWRNWQKKTAGGGGGRGRWPLARGTHQLFERRREQGGPINIQAKHALGQVRAASSKARNAPLRIYALPEVFSCQPITCRSSSDGDGNGDGDLAPKMLVHDTKPAKLKTKTGRLVLSLRTKMPPRRILEPSRAAAPPPPEHGVHQLLRPWLPKLDLQT